VLLFRWLLFKLRFMSGLAKLASGDPAWSGLTALNTYFEVQPLPNPLSWYAHQLPEWLLKVGTAGTLFVELVVPLMMFLPRRWRFAAAWLTIFWQVLIILTSNHNWINLLTIILCLFLFDDRALARVMPAGLRNLLGWRDVSIAWPRRHWRPASCWSAVSSSGNCGPCSAYPGCPARWSITWKPSGWSTSTTCSRP